MIEPTITITISEYNALIDARTERCKLPQKISEHSKYSRIKNIIKRTVFSLLCYKKNKDQQKLIKQSINCAVHEMYMDIVGYWNGDISEYMRLNLEGRLMAYRQDAYFKVMKQLNE